jgi:hypothetical protein
LGGMERSVNLLEAACRPAAPQPHQIVKELGVAALVLLPVVWRRERSV